MRKLGQINTKYLIFLVILLILMMLAVLLTHTEFANSMDNMYSGLGNTTGGITEVAENIRN